MAEDLSIVNIDVNSPGAMVAACLLSAVGALVFNIMPFFLGTAAESLGLNEQQLGIVASVYLGGFTLTSFSAVFWSRRVSWRKACCLAIVAAIAGYSGCLVWTGYLAVLSLLFIVGCAKGCFYAIALCALGDTNSPDRAFGLALLAMGGLGALGLFLLPYVSVGFGFNAILVALIAVTALVTVLLRWLPEHGLKENSSVQAQGGAKVFPVFVGLGGMLFLMTGLTALWAFLERIGSDGGLEVNAMGAALSATMFSTVVAGFLVSWLGDRFGRAIPIALGTLVMAAGIALFAGTISFYAFACGGILLMGGWTFVFAYQMAAISTADTSGKFVALIAAVQGVGSALGPGLAGAMITDEGFANVYVMGGGCLLVSLALFLWLVNMQTGTISVPVSGELG